MKLCLIKKSMGAVLVACLCTAASSTPVDISSGSAGFFHTPVAGNFSDAYTFTLSSTQTVNVLLSSVVGGSQNIDFTSVVIAGPQGAVFNGTAFTSDPFESWVIINASLSAGSYTLTTKGSNSAAIGSYAGTIALSGSSLSQSAGSGGPLDLSSGSTGLVNTPGPGLFSDAYTFTLSSMRAVSVMLSSAVGGGQDVDFTSVSIKGPSGTFNAKGFTEDPYENWTLSTPLLEPGSYTLTTVGTNSGAVGSYVGTVALSETGLTLPNSVPEPGSFGLVLAGLSAVLMTMRNRKLRTGCVSR